MNTNPLTARTDHVFRRLVLAWLILCPVSLNAQDLELNRGATAVYLRLKELPTSASVLHVVAHPDDEDGAMLAYCARGLGVRTMLFSITRGEGGANMISSHFFDELGALRTLEHLKAASYYGNELFYSRAADYGYSKTLEEAMSQWQGGIPILADLVEVIRRERPTVILSRFSGTPRDGHGHHQMAGVVSQLAFEAAADPTQFPEQLRLGLEPWQVKKLYVRAGSRWREPKPEDWTIALPTGTYDPVIGRTYAQIARFGLGFQRSQGISGHDGDAGPRSSYYRLTKNSAGTSADHEATLFDGCDVSLASIIPDGVAQGGRLRDSLARLEENLNEIYSTWNPLNRQPTLDALLQQLSTLRKEVISSSVMPTLSAGARRELDRLQRKLERAIVCVSGMEFSAWATGKNDEPLNQVAGNPFRIHLRLTNQSPLSVHVDRLVVATGEESHWPTSVSTQLDVGGVIESHVDIESTLTPTEPHWSRSHIKEPLYGVAPTGGQRPQPTTAATAEASLTMNGVPIVASTTVQTRIRHPEFGNVRYSLSAAPALSVRLASTHGIAVQGTPEYRLPVIVRSCRNAPVSGAVTLRLPSGWKAEPSRHSLSLTREDEEARFEFAVQIPADAPEQQHTIVAVATVNGDEFSRGFVTVTARDLGRMNIYRPASHQIQVADVRLLGSPKVAYIPGSGDEVAESLAALSIHPTVLSGSDLASGDLSRFDVILVGVRAYAVREDIRAHNARLLSYVRNGGTLIVQYQTPEFNQNFGPYPYDMSRPEEVSEEDAQVTILQPEHPLFNVPNRITAKDFDGWLEQRGSKFWRTWDPKYTPLLECHDKAQAPQQGGQMIARYGRGVYVYSAYAWYRQLPNGVPGAYRLFANMLSLPESGLVE